MKNHHAFLLRALGVLVAALVFLPTVALCYDVYGGGYDSYSGSYSSNWDYEDNSAYDSSYQYDSYDSNSSYSSSDSSYSSNSSNDTSGTVSSNATVKAGASVAKISSTVTVAVAGGPSNRLDWVGLYEVGAGARNYLDWQYLNGSKAAPSTGRASATLSFKMPATPGNYEFRFFPNNEYTLLAKSGTIDVKTELPAPAPEPDPTPAPTPAPAATPLPARSSSGPSYAASAPTGARLVTIDSYAYAYDAKTNTLIDYAMPELSTGKIYNRNNSSEIGKMLSATTGYLNEYVTVIQDEDDTAVSVPEATIAPINNTVSVSSPAPRPVNNTVSTNNAAVKKPAPIASAVKTAAPIANAPSATSAVTPAPTVVVPEVASLNKLVPAGAKIVFVENIDGVYTVFDKETGAAVPLAFYDVNTKNLYYGNSDELYGKMLTENMGYIEPDKFAAPATVVSNVAATGTLTTVLPELEKTNPIVVVVQKATTGVTKFFTGISGWFKSLFKWGK